MNRVVVEDGLTLADVERAAHCPPTSTGVLELAYQLGLTALDEFVEECVNPLLVETAGHNLKTALAMLHFRTHALLKTLLRIWEPPHFQTVVAMSRSMIDLHIDMQLLDKDLVPDAVERFHAFTLVQRLHAARQTVAFYGEYPELLNAGRDQTAMREFIEARGAAIDADAERLWGPSHPTHWSARTLRERAALVSAGCEKLVVEDFDYKTWVVQGDGAGVVGVTAETCRAMALSSKTVIHQLLIDCARLLGRQFAIETHGEGFDADLQTVDRIPSLVTADRQLMASGEPQRVVVRFPHRDAERADECRASP